MLVQQNQEYKIWLKELKNKIRNTQIKASLAVSHTIFELYWDFGKDIIEKQKKSNWGSNLIEQLSIDLKHEFPEINGFSRRNLYAIRQWYLFYSEHFEFVPQPVAQIPWGHNRLIISKIKEINQALFYAQATMENGWGRDINKPIGIADYKLTQAIPENLKTKLPTVEELENELIDKINKK
jgi:predicted nuclease of restriction endonuclease-like (RecB) superfamily